MRASGGRRDGFRKLIEHGNDAGDFAPLDNPDFKLPCVELLRDMDVRWDSTFLMIEQVILMRPVSDLPSELHASYLIHSVCPYTGYLGRSLQAILLRVGEAVDD